MQVEPDPNFLIVHNPLVFSMFHLDPREQFFSPKTLETS